METAVIPAPGQDTQAPPPAPDDRFPTLTAAQVARIALHGRRRAITRGELLVDVGDRAVPFFVVLSGGIQALRVFDGAETAIVTQSPGQFTGEGSLLTGRRAVTRLRASEDGEVLQLDRDELLSLIQNDAELRTIGSTPVGRVLSDPALTTWAGAS